MQKMSITMIVILLFVQILSNGFAQIPNIDDDKTLDTDVEIPSLTSARNNTSCGSNSSLTDLWASTDASTWGTWTNAVYGYYDVNCTVIGNNYTLEATIEITSQQTANGSAAWSSYSFWNWSETNNHEYMSEAWSNLTAGTYCVNATLWDVTSGTSTYVDSDYPCFTLTNSSGSGGNNTGGNNTGGNNSSCGSDSNLTSISAWTDATTYTYGTTVYADYYVNCTIPGKNYGLSVSLYANNGGSSYSSWSWNETNTYELMNGFWTNLSVDTYCLNATVWDNSGTSSVIVDSAFPCFTVTNASGSGGNNTGGNNTGGNNTDSDSDGYPDWCEQYWGTDPYNILDYPSQGQGCSGNNQNNHTSNCGNYSNLTNMEIWTSATTYTVGDAINIGWDVNCTVIGNNYTIATYIGDGTTGVYGGSNWFGWTAQWNPMGFADYNLNFTAGSYCFNATLYEFSTFIDFENTCFTVVNGSSGGNNTGGNNTGGNNLGGNSTNPLMPVINCSQIMWNASMNVTINDCLNQTNSFWFFFNQSGAVVWIDPIVAVGYDYIVYNGPSIVSVEIPLGYGDDVFDLYYYGTNGWYDSNVDIYGGVAHTFTTPVERMSVRGIEASEMLDPNDPNAFVSGLSFQNNGTVLMTMTPVTDNYTIPICGNDPSLTDLMTWTDAQTYPQGNTVYADYYVNCSINTEDYELHVYAYSAASGMAAWNDFTVWNWTETDSNEMMDDDWSNLAQGTYCVNATLYMVSGGPYQFVDFEVTCFTVTGSNGGGGNTTLNPCGLNSTYTEVWSWMDASTYANGDDQDATFYVNCTRTGSDYTLEYYVSEVGSSNYLISGMFTWVATSSNINFYDTFTGLGPADYCVLANLYESNVFLTDNGGTTCFTVLPSNNTGGNNTGGNNTTNPCGNNNSLISLGSWVDGPGYQTYQLWENQELNFYVNCTIIGNNYTLEYYVTEVGSSSWSYAGSWTWTASQTNALFTETISGLAAGDYCVIGNLYEYGTYVTNDGGNTCFTILPGNNTGGNNTGGNNTWVNATLDVDLVYHQWAGSYDTEQWLMVDQMNSGATYEVVWTLETCNGFNWMDSGTWSFNGVANQVITDFSIQPGWYCLVLEGELFENGNPVDWDMDTIWCNCSNGLNTTSPANNTPPQVSSVMIAPSWATETDVLTCTYVYSDLENDPDMSTITWTISGVPTTTVGPTLSSGYVAGDFVTCVVPSFDGTDYGNVGSTTSLIMTNSSGSSSGGGGGLPSIGIAGTIAAISAGFIFATRREDEE